MGQIKKFYSRAELGMRRPRSVSNNINPGNGGVAVHHGGGAQRITSQKQARDRWLAWQRHHMDGNGWVDIAYTAGFDNWGNVYAGRGYGVRTAANGTNAGNQSYLAFVWLGGGNEKPTAEALNALNWLIEDARKNGGAGNAVKPHKFFKATACPGNLTDRANELDGKSRLPAVPGSDTPTPEPNDPPAPRPEPEPESRNYITVGDKGAAVRSWQNDLIRWNSSALPRFGADGDFGAETAEWTTRFLRSAGLSVADPSAPRVGPKSLEAMKKALATPRFSFRYSTQIRRGSKGPAVSEWQTALRRWRRDSLPRFGVDGDFGGETHDWTVRFQRAAGIAVDGIVGPQTRRAMVSRLR